MSSATTTNDNNTSGSTEERLKKLMKEREEILRRDTTIHSQLDRIKELAQQEEECILEIEQRRLDAIMKEHEELHPLVT
jgi:aspartate oxidase